MIGLTVSAKSLTSFITAERPPCLDQHQFDGKYAHSYSPRISIRNYWFKIVDVLHLSSLLRCSGDAFVVVLLIV